MILGGDSGFFIKLASHHPRATQIWQEVANSKHRLLVSTVSVNEIFTYYFRRGMPNSASHWLISMSAMTAVEFVPVSTTIAARSAHFRHSLGLSTVDAIILATFVEHGCDQMITADSDFQVAVHQNIFTIEFLKP